jgi:hypothetical protein
MESVESSVGVAVDLSLPTCGVVSNEMSNSVTMVTVNRNVGLRVPNVQPAGLPLFVARCSMLTTRFHTLASATSWS